MSGNAVEARRHQLDKLLDPWGPPEVTWVKDHCLIKAQKVYLNYYDLLHPQSNWILGWLGLGGAYHAGVELFRQEYAFGGHYSDEYGIFSTKPLFEQRSDMEEQIHNLTDAGERYEVIEQLRTIPKLHSRMVIGWWRGTSGKFDDLLRQMKEQKHWKAPTYRLLSRNCNHFVHELCQQLLNHECFHALPGCSTVEELVPQRLTRLTDFALCCCPSFLSDGIDVPMLHAPYELDIFQGKAEKVGACTGLGMPAAVASARSSESAALLARTAVQHQPLQVPAHRQTVMATAGNLDTGQIPVQQWSLGSRSSAASMGFGGAKINITPSQKLARQGLFNSPLQRATRHTPGHGHAVVSASDVANEGSASTAAAHSGEELRVYQAQTPAGLHHDIYAKTVSMEADDQSAKDLAASSPFPIATPQRPAERLAYSSPMPSPQTALDSGNPSAEDSSPRLYTRAVQSDGGLCARRHQQIFADPSHDACTNDRATNEGATQTCESITKIPRRKSLPPLHRKGGQYGLSDPQVQADSESLHGPATPLKPSQGAQTTSPFSVHPGTSNHDVHSSFKAVDKQQYTARRDGGFVGKPVVEAAGFGQKRPSMIEMVMETLHEVSLGGGRRKAATAQEIPGYSAKLTAIDAVDTPGYSGMGTPRTPPVSDLHSR